MREPAAGDSPRTGRPQPVAAVPSAPVPPAHDGSAAPVRLHYSRGLSAAAWDARHRAGEVPDRWPYGLHQLDVGTVQPVRPRHSLAARAVRKVAGGYEWDRRFTGGDVALCWDERAGVPVALSGVPTLTGVIWLTERDRRHWTDALAQRALARATIFVLSPHQLTDLQQRWRVPASQTHFVPFGVDDDFWRPEDGEREGVLIVGNDRHRDHMTAVRAALRAKSRYTLVTKQQLAVPRTTHLSHGALRSAYADHAVVAMAAKPNRHASGLTVVLEAMSCARPVVATQGSGLEEYITPDTGILVPAGDDEQMARAIRRLLDDPQGAEAMGRAGREAVERRYNTRALASSLSTLARTL